MEALSFSFLKFWRTTGTGATTCGGDAVKGSAETTNFPAVENDNEVDEEDSFFELEFTVPDCDNEENRDNQGDNKDKDGERFDIYDHSFNDPAKRVGHSELNFTQSNLKRRILPIEPNLKPQSPISILKSAPKFRVFMFGFKKSKTEKTEKTESTSSASMATPKHRQQESKLLAVKFSVDGPSVVSMFTRENSSRESSSKLQKQSTEDDYSSKRFSKDVVQKYLKLIKPLYVKVSKRYNEKLGFSDVVSTASPASSPAPAPAPASSPKKSIKTMWKKEDAGEKQGNIPAGLRVVCKHLGKSRSASAAVGVVLPPVSRRDDSLLQQHDGIQSAILHCKKSFNSSRESSLLSRSTSESSSREKPVDSMRKSTEEEKVASN